MSRLPPRRAIQDRARARARARRCCVRAGGLFHCARERSVGWPRGRLPDGPWTERSWLAAPFPRHAAENDMSVTDIEAVRDAPGTLPSAPVPPGRSTAHLTSAC